MKNNVERIEGIISKIQDMKSTVDRLKSERDTMQIKITHLEKEIEELKSKPSGINDEKANEIKANIDRQVRELDDCLDMLKTV